MICNIIKCPKCGTLDIVFQGMDNRYRCAECNSSLFPKVQPMEYEIDDRTLAAFVIMEGERK
jgi:transposase-like protein